ncbi:MAG TPA: metalloregulator ArsR/SmtB family transcription factor [candidate division Zixibacteria bacterium]
MMTGRKPRDAASGTLDVCTIESFDPKKVSQARAGQLDDAEVERLSSIFSCLGHPTRVKILRALSRTELCVCDLAQVLGATVSAVSHQLRTLRMARLVKFRRAGKMAYYSIDDDHVRAVFASGLDHIRHVDDGII